MKSPTESLNGSSEFLVIFWWGPSPCTVDPWTNDLWNDIERLIWLMEFECVLFNHRNHEGMVVSHLEYFLEFHLITIHQYSICCEKCEFYHWIISKAFIPHTQAKSSASHINNIPSHSTVTYPPSMNVQKKCASICAVIVYWRTANT